MEEICGLNSSGLGKAPVAYYYGHCKELFFAKKIWDVSLLTSQ
jgi:hypothetical protein